MSEYTEQAKKFLEDCNATMTIELIGCDVPAHWKDETKKHNHYKFTITTYRGKMEDDFWDSIYNTERYNMTAKNMAVKLRFMNSWGEFKGLPLDLQNKVFKKLKKYKENCVPTEYDILACLETYVPNTFDDFCDEFGYDNDSISALNTYLACQKQWSKLCKIFTEEQIEALQKIQ